MLPRTVGWFVVRRRADWMRLCIRMPIGLCISKIIGSLFAFIRICNCDCAVTPIIAEAVVWEVGYNGAKQYTVCCLSGSCTNPY